MDVRRLALDVRHGCAEVGTPFQRAADHLARSELEHPFCNLLWRESDKTMWARDGTRVFQLGHWTAHANLAGILQQAFNDVSGEVSNQVEAIIDVLYEQGDENQVTLMKGMDWAFLREQAGCEDTREDMTKHIEEVYLWFTATRSKAFTKLRDNRISKVCASVREKRMHHHLLGGGDDIAKRLDRWKDRPHRFPSAAALKATGIIISAVQTNWILDNSMISISVLIV